METLLDIDNRLFGDERRQHPPCKVVLGEYKLYPSDKGYPHTYVPVYEELFKPLRESITSVLEIGIAQGGSLALWNEYFYNAKLIYGIDFNGCSSYDRSLAENLYNSKYSPDKKIISFESVLENALSPYNKVKYDINVDAYSASACDKVLCANNNEKYDIIIDDGSHNEQDMFYFIENYGTYCLKNNGILIIEDCHLEIFNNLSKFKYPFEFEYFGYEGAHNLGYPDNMLIIRKLGASV